MAVDSLSRRSLLELAIRAASLPAGAQFFAAWAKASHVHWYTTGSAPPPDPHVWRGYQPKFFSPEDFEALQAITEILIPKDDAPGARDAYCAEFIDFVLHSDEEDNFARDTQEHWQAAMKALRQAGFHAADQKGREAVVREISLPERNPTAKHPAFFAYKLIKRENAFVFYTSRAGIIQNLDYKGNSFNLTFPACTHPEHHVV